MNLQKKLIEILFQKYAYHPMFLFAQLFSVHFIGKLHFNLALMVLAIIATLITRINYFWFVGIAITPGSGIMSLVNVVFGCLSIN
jgi:hypothetical protein